MAEASEDLKELVSSTVERIKEGLKGKECGIVEAIEFELAVVKEKQAGGKFRFIVAEAGGNYASGTISEIKFSVIGSKTSAREHRMIWLNET